LTVAAHGAQKLFGWFEGPGVEGFAGGLDRMGVRPARQFAVLAGLGELGGGILAALGLLFPVGPLVVAAGMVVAIFTVHYAKGFFSAKGGYEFPFVVLATMVGLSITGPGLFSVDALIRLHLPEPATWIVVAIVVGLSAIAALESRRFRRRHELC
jgi:putative oxidoreductase